MAQRIPMARGSRRLWHNNDTLYSELFSLSVFIFSFFISLPPPEEWGNLKKHIASKLLNRRNPEIWDDIFLEEEEGHETILKLLTVLIVLPINEHCSCRKKILRHEKDQI